MSPFQCSPSGPGADTICKFHGVHWHRKASRRLGACAASTRLHPKIDHRYKDIERPGIACSTAMKIFLRNSIFCSCSGCHKRSQWHCHVFICVSSISQRVHEFKNKFRDATVPCFAQTIAKGQMSAFSCCQSYAYTQRFFRSPNLHGFTFHVSCLAKGSLVKSYMWMTSGWNRRVDPETWLNRLL